MSGLYWERVIQQQCNGVSRVEGAVRQGSSWCTAGFVEQLQNATEAIAART